MDLPLQEDRIVRAQLVRPVAHILEVVVLALDPFLQPSLRRRLLNPLLQEVDSHLSPDLNIRRAHTPVVEDPVGHSLLLAGSHLGEGILLYHEDRSHHGVEAHCFLDTDQVVHDCLVLFPAWVQMRQAPLQVELDFRTDLWAAASNSILMAGCSIWSSRHPWKPLD